MACTPPSYQNTKNCIDAEALSVVERVWYADFDAFQSAVEGGDIILTENEITGFGIGITPLFYQLWQGIKFDPAPTGTSALSGAGSRKFMHSAIMQVNDASADADKQISLINQSRLVYVFELKGTNATNKADRLKVFGVNSGLTVADGGIVQNAMADGGAALITVSTDTERGDFENYNRHTITVADDFLANAIVAAV